LADHVATPEAREKLFDGALPEHAKTPTKRTMAAHINSALADEMLRFPEIIVFARTWPKRAASIMSPRAYKRVRRRPRL